MCPKIWCDEYCVKILGTKQGQGCLIGLRVNLPQSARILRSHAKVRRDLPFSDSFGILSLARSQEGLVVWYRVCDKNQDEST